MSNDSEKKLRREVEILKAQLAGKGGTKESPKLGKEKTRESSKDGNQPAVVKEDLTDGYVKKDLKRSLLITAGILTLITTLYLTQPYWTTIIRF